MNDTADRTPTTPWPRGQGGLHSKPAITASGPNTIVHMNELIAAMKALTEGPSLSFFTSYREDFEAIDLNELTTHGSPKAEYLWIVRSDGTDLVRLGVHERESQWGSVVLSGLRGTTCALFHLKAGTVQEVDTHEAQCLLARLDYAVFDDGSEAVLVTYKHTGASARVTFGRSETYPTCADRYDARVEADDELWNSLDHLTALRLIAVHEGARRRRWLSKLDEIRINGVRYTDRVRLLKAEPTTPARDGIGRLAEGRPETQA